METKQSKAKQVINYYVLCNKLKYTIRTGWQNWNVKRDRIESVAEHVFGVQSLAIAMYSEYDYDLDLSKVILMLAVHELEEIIIGDLTPWNITPNDHSEKGRAAIQLILKDLIKKDQIKALIDEFNARETKEAKFAYYCDKLETDIQSKLYDEQGCVDLKHQVGNSILNDQEVKKYLELEKTWSGAWIEYWRKKARYDENFTEVSKYVQNNLINIKED